MFLFFLPHTLPSLRQLNHVIDLGLAKQITYNELSHRQMLEPVWISRASATQRAGRTGRIAPGVVFRLYSRECFDRYMTAFEPGEMVRVPLDTVILTLKEMMADDERVSDVLDDCIEPPNMSTIRRSYKVSSSLKLFSDHRKNMCSCPHTLKTMVDRVCINHTSLAVRTMIVTLLVLVLLRWLWVLI